MQVKFIIAALLALATLPAHAASDDAQWYIGLDAQSVSTKFSAYESTFTLDDGVTEADLELDGTFSNTGAVGGAALRLGYHFTNFFSAEVHLAGREEVEDDDTGTTFAMAAAAAGFLRLNLPYKKVIVYALGGGGAALWTMDIPGFESQQEVTAGPAFGGGIEIYGSEHTAFNLSSITYVGRPDFQHTAISFGIVHWFNFPSLYRRF